MQENKLVLSGRVLTEFTMKVFDPRNEKELKPSSRVIKTSINGKIESTEDFMDYLKKEIIFLNKHISRCKVEKINPSWNW